MPKSGREMASINRYDNSGNGGGKHTKKQHTGSYSRANLNQSARNSSSEQGDALLSKVINASPGMVIGRNATAELLKSGRSVDKLFVRRGDREGSINVIIAEAVKRGIPVIEVDNSRLYVLSGGAHHQGVVAMAAEKDYCTVDEILDVARSRGEVPLIVIADGIEDPHNMGAVIRSAECAGAHGLIIPKRRSAGLSPAVTKSSAGAVEHIAVAKVPNLAAAVESLKKTGVWIYTAEAGGVPYYECDFTLPSAVIFGSEGEGVSRLLREKSDFIVSVPLYGKINSLNVSCAAAVILSEAARQTRTRHSM